MLSELRKAAESILKEGLHATGALILEDERSTDMVKTKLLKLLKDQELKKATTDYLMDVVNNDNLYKRVLEKVVIAAKDPELKAAASDYLQKLAGDKKLKTRAVEFVQEVSADQKIYNNIIRSLTVAARQSLKQNCPRVAGGTVLGVGSAVAGLYALKTFCKHSKVGSNDNEEHPGAKATYSPKGPEI